MPERALRQQAVDPYSGQTAAAGMEQARTTVAGLGYEFISAASLGANQMSPFEVIIENPLPGIAGYALVVLGF